MMISRLQFWAIGGVGALILVVTLAVCLRVIGAQAADLREKDRQLLAASRALKQASTDIERFAKDAGVTAAEAARICAVEGSSAFDRGVAFGAAVCEAGR
jgi:hypothetical protein